MGASNGNITEMAFHPVHVFTPINLQFLKSFQKGCMYSCTGIWSCIMKAHIYSIAIVPTLRKEKVKKSWKPSGQSNLTSLQLSPVTNFIMSFTVTAKLEYLFRPHDKIFSKQLRMKQCITTLWYCWRDRVWEGRTLQFVVYRS